jgi:hypothetical protein
VWLCIAGIYCLAALVFWVSARLSPEEKAAAHKTSASSTMTAGTQTGLGSHMVAHLRGPVKLNPEPAPFSLGNCFWFLIANLLFRTTTTNPKV